MQLSLPEVSKHHAFLHRTPTGWRVRDMDSRNGLLVNGRLIREADVRDGDRLTIGPYTLVFELVEAGQPYKPLLELDMSGNAAQQTIPQTPRRPG